MTTLSGAFPVLPTIFHSDGAVDEPSFLRVAEWAITCGVDGVVFPGLASEYDYLALDERCRLMTALGDLTRGRVAFVAGCGGRTDEESVALMHVAGDAGAVAAMVVTPARKGDDPAALITFYDRLAQTADVPLMLQNAPRPMGLGLDPSTILAIAAAVPAIRYVKEENMPCGQRITALKAGSTGLASVFGGAGGRYITDELARGARGTMPAVEIADIHVKLITAWRAGDRALVRTLFERSLPLLTMQAVFRWRLTKEVLLFRGLINCAFVRAPGPALDTDDRKELAELLNGIADLLDKLPIPILATA